VIHWYVDKLHVGTPDEVIIEDFFGRCERAGYHPLVAVAVCETALARHHRNLASYMRIMSGAF
jgi:hypothetical protein